MALQDRTEHFNQLWVVQKLTAEELKEQLRREQAASAQGVSVWNQVHFCPALYLTGF